MRKDALIALAEANELDSTGTVVDLTDRLNDAGISTDDDNDDEPRMAVVDDPDDPANKRGSKENIEARLARLERVTNVGGY